MYASVDLRLLRTPPKGPNFARKEGSRRTYALKSLFGKFVAHSFSWVPGSKFAKTGFSTTSRDPETTPVANSALEGPKNSGAPGGAVEGFSEEHFSGPENSVFVQGVYTP